VTAGEAGGRESPGRPPPSRSCRRRGCPSGRSGGAARRCQSGRVDDAEATPAGHEALRKEFRDDGPGDGLSRRAAGARSGAPAARPAGAGGAAEGDARAGARDSGTGAPRADALGVGAAVRGLLLLTLALIGLAGCQTTPGPPIPLPPPLCVDRFSGAVPRGCQ
jgi:hypothetical protein